MIEIILNELGYFTEKEAQNLAQKLNGKTYMRFDIGYSKYRGDANCTLMVSTKYFDNDTEKTENEKKAELKNFFLSYALNTLAHTK